LLADGRFSLDGRDCQLKTSNAAGGIACHLHGGQHGFHRQLWTIENIKSDAVRFRYCSADGEEGYPGNFTVAVAYQVGPGRVLTWTAEATTDAPTIVNVVHHPYRTAPAAARRPLARTSCNSSPMPTCRSQKD